MNAIPKKRGGCLVWIVRLALGLILVFGLLLAAGYSYQTRTTAADFEQFPAPGQRVDVGGFSLHIRCTGTGSPTIVIDTGNGDFSLGWQGIQPEIAKSTRICTYDRAGYGWSDLSPNPRTAESFVTELHSLLVNAGEKPPYILVGQSLGGFTVRMFASQYPGEVSGMVLVDAGHEQQLERVPPEYAQINQQQISYLGAMQFMSRFGSLRVLGNASGGADLAPPQVRKLPAEIQPVYLAMMSHPSYFDVTLAELRALSETSQEVRTARRQFDFPLIVLTAENTPDPEAMQAIGMPADFDVAKIQQTWRELQADLATLSPQGEHFIVEGSGHAIELDKPQAVIDAILEVLALARQD